PASRTRPVAARNRATRKRCREIRAGTARLAHRRAPPSTPSNPRSAPEYRSSGVWTSADPWRERLVLVEIGDQPTPTDLVQRRPNIGLDIGWGSVPHPDGLIDEQQNHRVRRA